MTKLKSSGACGFLLRCFRKIYMCIFDGSIRGSKLSAFKHRAEILMFLQSFVSILWMRLSSFHSLEFLSFSQIDASSIQPGGCFTCQKAFV